jgi:hypothetical protein
MSGDPVPATPATPAYPVIPIAALNRVDRHSVLAAVGGVLARKTKSRSLHGRRRAVHERKESHPTLVIWLPLAVEAGG